MLTLKPHRFCVCKEVQGTEYYLIRWSCSDKKSKFSPCLLWNPKVPFILQRSPPPDPILSQINPVHNLKSYLIRINFNTVCPTRYRARHFFNNYNTNEDIATKFEQEYVRCVRNEEECVCSVCL
jgi:hypothetical protein